MEQTPPYGPMRASQRAPLRMASHDGIRGSIAVACIEALTGAVTSSLPSPGLDASLIVVRIQWGTQRDPAVSPLQSRNAEAGARQRVGHIALDEGDEQRQVDPVLRSHDDHMSASPLGASR